MKIAIEATGALKFAGGVSRYIQNLIERLSKIDKENKYYIYYHFFRIQGKKRLSLENKNNFFECCSRFPQPLYRYFRNVLPITPDCILPKDINLIHFTDHYVDVSNNFSGKKIVTIHDLFVFICPQYMKRITIKNYSERIEKSIKKADIIITVSQSSKKDIINHFNVKEEKIKVIYLGYTPDIFKQLRKKEDLNLLRKKHNLPSKYFLTVGVISPRKNIENVIKSFEAVKCRYKEYKLIIAGKKGWDYRGVMNCYERSRFKEDILFIDTPSDEVLSVVYNLADIFLFPSFYEGFGLPLLESMACGVPVITSNVSSLPEIAGDAAILVNPTRIDEITAAIDTIVNNETIRLELINKGLNRVKLFSWEETAMQTLNLYKEIANGQ